MLRFKNSKNSCQSTVQLAKSTRMDHKSQPKSRLAAITFAQEQHCLNRAGSKLNITSQWKDPEILLFFCYKSILQKNRSHAENPCAQVSS